MKFTKREDLQGSRNHHSKLTEDQVLAIRCAYEVGKPKLRVMAEKYGVTTSTIWHIRSRESWRHI